MYQLTSINDKPKQSFNIVVENYDNALMNIEFKPEQLGWFMSIEWGNFAIYNERISCSLNLLRQFKNIIPFGILINGSESIDPLTIDSWITTNKFYILEQNDIEEIEELYVK